MVLELGLQAPEEGDSSPWAKGAVTFGAFVLFGSVPLISFIVAAGAGAEGDLLFGLCIAFTLATIFILGAVSGHFSQVCTRTGGLTLFIFLDRSNILSITSPRLSKAVTYRSLCSLPFVVVLMSCFRFLCCVFAGQHASNRVLHDVQRWPCGVGVLLYRLGPRGNCA